MGHAQPYSRSAETRAGLSRAGIVTHKLLILNPAVRIATATQSETAKKAALEVFYPHPEGNNSIKLCGDVTAYLAPPWSRCLLPFALPVLIREAATFTMRPFRQMKTLLPAFRCSSRARATPSLTPSSIRSKRFFAVGFFMVSCSRSCQTRAWTTSTSFLLNEFPDPPIRNRKKLRR